MSKHVSEHMGLKVSSHSEIEFVDVVMAPDTRLFLDPCLIEFGKDDWCIQAQKTISNYFDRFYGLYQCRAHDDEKLRLFEFAHEINATRLGYGNGHNGKAKTPMGMLQTFSTVGALRSSGIEISKPSDLPVFIKDFAEDCLSDMLTNILFGHLMEFTLLQCQRYGVATSKTPKPYFYWDCVSSNWKAYEGRCLLIEGHLILLVPKHIVRDRYYFTASQYFSRIILGKIQDDESWIDPKGKTQKPAKKQLREKYQGADETVRDCAIRLTSEKPQYLPDYHRQLPGLYSGQGMTDEELDAILY